MKIAFRNFLSTLRRYKVASLLNIVGLTLAFIAFYVIMVQVWWELTYNRGIDDAGQVYVVAPAEKQGGYSCVNCRPFGEQLIEQSPEVEAGGCIRPWFTAQQTVWVRRNGELSKMTVPGNAWVSRGFIDAMRLRVVEGDLNALSGPNTIALSETVARQTGLGAGGTLYVQDKEQWPPELKPAMALEVVAVYEDLPRNSMFAQMGILQDIGDNELTNMHVWNDVYFVRLRKGADPTAVARRWSAIQAETIREQVRQQSWFMELPAEKQEELLARECRLYALPEMYYAPDLTVSFFTKGSLQTTLSLLAVAILVIVIALINFVNFFFALVPSRLRTVNTFKVFGAPTRALRFSFLFEAVGFVLASLLVAWYVAFTLQGTEFANYISASLLLSENLAVVGIELLVAVAAALVAGFYPAWYITSFNPALAAKGYFAGSRSGRRLRTALVSVQFTISIALIVFTFFCAAQHRYIRHFDLGFAHDDVLTFTAPTKVSTPEGYRDFAARMESDPQIEAVAGSASQFVEFAWSQWGWKIGDEQVFFHMRIVRGDLFKVLRIPILEGEGFGAEQERDSLKRVVIPRRTAERYGLRVGDRFRDAATITGICGDLQFRPLQCQMEQLAIMSAGTKGGGARYIYVRTRPGADIEAVCDHIRAVCRAVDPDFDEPRIRFMDEQIDELYNKEERLATIVALFALLSIGIALMGVFGLVLFETQYRRREIAVRKVMGATTEEVLTMFNRRYLLIAAACFVVAIPAAWWAVDRYLQQFAYRTPMSWWIFLAAFAAVAAITAATVTLRSLAAARSNPADAVKSE